MDRYYFLKASLPTPVFGQKPPMSSEAFISLCARNLSDRDLADLGAADAEPGSARARAARGIIGKYLFREIVLRNELARLRGQRLSADPLPYLREPGAPVLDPEPARSAQAVFLAGDPLKCEIELERSRWRWLDLEAALDVFDWDALAAYRLRLALLERLERYAEESGAHEYDAVYGAVLGDKNGVRG